MANSALGEPYCCRNSVFQCSNTLRIQISATCESSLVVSSSDATFASLRKASPVVYRAPQQTKARWWFPRAMQRLQARERRSGSSHGPSKNVEQKKPDLRSSCRLISAGSAALHRTREAQNRFAADKARLGGPDRA